MGAYGDMNTAVAGLKADNNLVTRIESKSAQEDIEFGVPVYSYLGEEDKVSTYKADTATLVYTGDFVTANVINVTVNGVAISPVTFDADHATTIALVVAGIDGLTGVEAMLDATDENSRTILIRTRYVTNVSSSVVTLGATQVTASATYSSDQVFVGVSMFIQKSVSCTTGGYLQDEAVSVMTIGIIWTFNDNTANAFEIAKVNGSLFSDTNGVDVGVIFKSDNTVIGSDNLAKVELKGSKKLASVIVWS